MDFTCRETWSDFPTLHPDLPPNSLSCEMHTDQTVSYLSSSINSSGLVQIEINPRHVYLPPSPASSATTSIQTECTAFCCYSPCAHHARNMKLPPMDHRPRHVCLPTYLQRLYWPTIFFAPWPLCLSWARLGKINTPWYWAIKLCRRVNRTEYLATLTWAVWF